MKDWPDPNFEDKPVSRLAIAIATLLVLLPFVGWFF
jgi:hypothetical protein